jgi:hypothetical protein
MLLSTEAGDIPPPFARIGKRLVETSVVLPNGTVWSSLIRSAWIERLKKRVLEKSQTKLNG